jgi:hypothetical protein
MMETTGEIFNPEYYMIDKETRIVYRKEQFEAGTDLPQELLVRDKRYTAEEIEVLCHNAGLEMIWTHFVKAGSWNEPLPSDSDHAKELLVLCRRP